MHYGHVLGGVDGRTPTPVRDLVAILNLIDDKQARNVGETEVHPGVVVTTNFIPVMTYEGIHFETQVRGDHPLRGVQARYATWDQAAEGHLRFVRIIKEWDNG